MKHYFLTPKTYLSAFLTMPYFSFSANGESDSSYFSNPLFITLLVLIILLSILITALSGAVKNLSQSEFIDKKIKEEKNSSGISGKVTLLVIALIFSFADLHAENNLNHGKWLIGGLDMFTFYFMCAIILIQLIFVFSLLNIIKQLIKTESRAKEQIKKPLAVKDIFDKLNAAVEIENEEEILMDHEYDGIRELDNNLPPWWKYGFYLTVFVGFVYMIHYHVTKTGDLQAAEYTKEVNKAKTEIAEYMKNAANNVDETTVKFLDSPTDMAAGKEVFLSVCSACHGKLGEGGVGPNFADEYWIHGGSVQDIFKTIKYGFPDKGMKAWKEDLSPMQIAQVTSYIKTLTGTNPPNQKAPQGDLYAEKVVTDTLTTVLKSDSISK